MLRLALFVLALLVCSTAQAQTVSPLAREIPAQSIRREPDSNITGHSPAGDYHLGSRDWTGAPTTTPCTNATTTVEWNTCGVVASDAASCKGNAVSVSRASTDSCICANGSTLTAQANQLCVTEVGAHFPDAQGAIPATISTTGLGLTTSGPISVYAEASHPTWDTSMGGPATLFSIGDFAPKGALVGSISDAASFYCTVWDSAGSLTTWSRGAIPPGTLAGTLGIRTHRLGCEWSGSGYPNVYIDGTLTNTAQGGNGGTGHLGSIPATIGIGGWKYYRTWGGTIANVNVCPTGMAACEARQGLRSPTLRQKKILAIGDSITYGIGSTAQNPTGAYLPRLLTALGGTWEGVGAGVQSEQTAAMLTRYLANYQNSYFSDVVVLSGVNDCNQSQPAAMVKTNLRTVYDAIHASGARVVAVTILPLANAKYACVEEVNTWIRQQTDVTVVDGWALFDDGAHGWKVNYSVDGVHPNEAGHALLAQTIQSQGGPWTGAPSLSTLRNSVGMASCGSVCSIDLNAADFTPGDTTWKSSGSGLSFAKSGAPTPWVGTPFYPDGYDEALHNGAGPFSDSVHYTLGTGNDALDVADVRICALFETPSNLAAYPVIYSNGLWHSAGIYLYLSPDGALIFDTTDTGVVRSLSTTNKVAVGGQHIGCGWRKGAHQCVQLDGGAAICTANGYTTVATNNVAFLGRYDATGQSFAGRIFEVSASSTTDETDADVQTVLNAGLSCRSALGSVAAPCLPVSDHDLTHVTFASDGSPIDTKGLSWAKVGSPAVSSSVYVWPNLRTPLAQPAVGFNGSNDYFSGTLAVPATEFTIWGKVKMPASSAGKQPAIIEKDGAVRSFGLNQMDNAVKLRLWTFNAAGNATPCDGPAGADAGSWVAFVVTYKYVADQTSLVHFNVNGAVTDCATARGPLVDSAQPMLIGNHLNADYWGGQIADLHMASVAVSSATAAQMVASQLGLVAGKPANTVLPFSRDDVGSVCPLAGLSDWPCFKVGAGVPEIDRRGIWRGGQSANRLVYSDPDPAAAASSGNWRLGGIEAGTPTITGSKPDPFGGTTGVQADFPAVSSGYSLLYHFQSFAASAVPHTGSCWTRAASGTPNVYLSMTPDGSSFARSLCSPTTTGWTYCSVTGTLTATNWYFQVGVDKRDAAQASQPAGSVIFAKCAVTPTPVPIPFRATNGSAYTGVATTHQGVPPRTDSEQWTNLALQSEDFGTTWVSGLFGAWVAPTVTVNARVAKDGSFSADKLTSTHVASCALGQRISALPSTAYVGSVWVDTPDTAYPLLKISTAYNGTMVRNLLGTASCETPLAPNTPTRCWVSATTAASGENQISFDIAFNGGVLGRSFYAWGGQVELGTTPSLYCPTGASAATCGNTGGIGKTVTNLAAWSEDLTQATKWTKEANATITPDVSGTLDQVDSQAGGYATVYQTFTVSSSAGPFTVRSKIAKPTGSGTTSFGVRCAGSGGNAATCTCAASDGSACTASASAGNCSANFTTTTTPVVGRVTLTCTNAETALQAFVHGGSFSASTAGSSLFGESQLEASAFAGRYCGPTGASSKKCVFPERPAQPECLFVRATPSGAWNASTFRWLGSMQTGVWDAAQEMHVYSTGGNVITKITDALGGTLTSTFIGNLSGSTDTLAILACFDGQGGSSVAVNGAPLTLAWQTGSGTGILSRVPATSFNLMDSSLNYNFYGWLRSWATCKGYGGCR